MLARLFATILCLNAACLGFAGPYLVEFEGTIIEIADGAPDTFWIGERVVGAFVYDPAAPTAFSVHHSFQLVHGNAGDGWPDQYSVFPGAERVDFLAQVWRGGNLTIATEGGFAAYDDSLDILWMGRSTGSSIQFAPSFFHAGNSGHWMNQILGDTHVPLTLITESGPQATALQISFGDAVPEFVFDDEGVPEATLSSLGDPAQLRPTKGGFSFGEPAVSLATDATDVTFAIDRFSILAVPEPAASVSLLLACLGAMLRRRVG